ncbi:threonine synthase [bacterium]|nr:threonine synthase [bacterium]
MKYISTRGETKPRTFVQVVIDGLARDGGLYVPEEIPDFSGKLESLKDLKYQQLAYDIFRPFIDGEIDNSTLKGLIERSYCAFSVPEITPVRFIDNIAILELFHGPTLAFKDVALQFLGNLFEEILKKQRTTLNILGATSGDTGSAAIYGVRGKENISIFMLHPKGKVSPVQEKQMTTVLDNNVHNIAVKGTFDDAQRIVKEIFNDLAFKDKYSLGAVNSINWARVMAQIVYYFYSAFRFEEKFPGKPLVFSVPTGNFGDIYAGYLAKKMGLPIEKLILATNENDILFRTLETGIYKISNVFSSLSPSMDIQIASNFERFLFDIYKKDGKKVQQKMNDLTQKGEFHLTNSELIEARSVFTSIRIDTKRTLEAIKLYKNKGVILDPHTAVGVAAAEESKYSHVITLATAHPAKFSEAVFKAIGAEPEIPQALDGLLKKESKCLITQSSAIEIKQIIEATLNL